MLNTDLAPGQREEVASEYFARCEAAFDHAVAVAGEGVDVRLRIAGQRLRLRFAGPALQPAFSSAFWHLTIPEFAAPDIEIALWDTASTRTELPRVPWHPREFGPLGRVRGYEDTKVVPLLDPSYRALALVDAEAGRALFCVPSAAGVPWYEHAAPLRSILHLLLGARGIRLVHGAAVASEGRAALLVGKGGSGKSTLALSSLASGLQFLGDDYVAVSAAQSPVVHSLYGTGKVGQESMRFLPELATAVVNPGHGAEEKTILDLRRYRRGDVLAEAALGAVVVPKLTGARRAQIKPAPTPDVLLALAPTTVLQLPGQDAEALAVSARIVREVHSHVLELGEPRDGAAALREVLDRER